MQKSDIESILPKGIQVVEKTHKDGKKVFFYRVQMKRQHISINQLFAKLPDALDCLNAKRAELNLAPVKLATELARSKDYSEMLEEIVSNPTFSQYVDSYLQEYVKPKYEEYEVDLYYKRNVAQAKAKLRNYTNTLSFYTTICKTVVSVGSLGSLDIVLKAGTFGLEKKKFGDLLIDEITPRVINSYIKSRMELGLRGMSIQREITFISNVFSKLHKLNEVRYDSPVKNPTRDYDRELLDRAKKPKRTHFRFSDERKKAFLAEVEKHENPEFTWIVKIMLHTAMRRSEVLLLTWSQVHDNYIELYDTKTNPRPVYLTAEAKEIFKNIPRKPGQQRVFSSYSSVAGFEGSYTKFIRERKFVDENGNEMDFSDITSHKLRKEAISNFVEKIGADNSLLIAEILGISSVRKLEENIKQMPTNTLNKQSEVLQSVGHANSQITKKHYFSLRKK